MELLNYRSTQVHCLTVYRKHGYIVNERGQNNHKSSSEFNVIFFNDFLNALLITVHREKRQESLTWMVLSITQFFLNENYMRKCFFKTIKSLTSLCSFCCLPGFIELLQHSISQLQYIYKTSMCGCWSYCNKTTSKHTKKKKSNFNWGFCEQKKKHSCWHNVRVCVNVIQM